MLFLRALPGDTRIQPLRGWAKFPTSNCILFRSSGLSVFRTIHSTPDFSVPPGVIVVQPLRGWGYYKLENVFFFDFRLLTIGS